MLTSPKRLISFVMVIGYYIWVFIRPTVGNRPIAFAGLPSQVQAYQFDFPPMALIDAFVFAAFTLISLPMIAQLTKLNRTMSAADVDVLFPTPVSPKLVMVLRLIRDYAAALLFPLILGVIAWRPIQLSGIFTHLPNPSMAGYVLKTGGLAWLLLAIVYTSFGYATTLFVNRSDLQSDRNQKLIDRSITALVLGTLVFVAAMLAREFSIDQAIKIADSPLLRTLYFIPTLGTIFALGPLTHPINTVLAGVALLLLSVLGFQIALSQVGWMYDQAAVRGFETLESMRLRRSGDTNMLLAASAKSGKIKAGRKTRLHSLRVRPPFAMIWREAVIQLRAKRSVTTVFLLISLFYSLLPVILFKVNGGVGKHPHGSTVEGGMFIFFQAMGVFMATMGAAQTGYIELLKRTDLLKPLPFSPGRLMMTEVFAKSAIPVVVSLFCTMVGMILEPALAPLGLGYLIFGPTLAVLLSSCTLTVTLLFPEVNDPTQRGFRGLMQMLGLALCVAPGAITYVVLAGVVKMPVLGAMIGAVLNAGIASALLVAAGYLYLGFNPTE